MGHNRLPRLPSTKAWNEVAAIIASPSTDDEIIQHAAEAAEASFLDAPDDPVFNEAVRLLVGIAGAGRALDFVTGLRTAGLAITGSPDLSELLQAVSSRLDDVSRDSSDATDLGEIARRALIATVIDRTQEDLTGLFELGSDDVRRAVTRLSNPREFALLARGFFVRMTSETLSYWLDRELAAHVGRSLRFGDLTGRREFDAALNQYSWEATRIIREFCGGWYARALNDGGGALERRAGAFSAVALKKINSELRRKRGADE